MAGGAAVAHGSVCLASAPATLAAAPRCHSLPLARPRLAARPDSPLAAIAARPRHVGKTLQVLLRFHAT